LSFAGASAKLLRMEDPMEEEAQEPKALFNDEGWNKLISSDGLTLITGTRSFEDEATLRTALEKIVETIVADAKQNGKVPWTVDDLEVNTKELRCDLCVIDRSGVIMPLTELRMRELAELAETMPIVLVCQRPPSLPAQRKPYSIVEVRFVAKPTPAVVLAQVKNREGANAPEMLLDLVTGDLTELSQLGDPDCCADLEDEDEEASIKSLADKLATLNQRLIPGQEAQALELAKVWLADPKRGDVDLAVTLAKMGVSECTAKEAERNRTKLLWKLGAEFDAEYFSHIRPEYVTRCDSGVPITLAERREMTANSWEVAYLTRYLDDEALLAAARYAGDNSRWCLSRVTRWAVPTTYDEAVLELYLPRLLSRLDELRKHNALMREELIRLASSVKTEPELMRVLSIADTVAQPGAEESAADHGCQLDLQIVPGAYSSGDTNPEDDIELPGGSGGGVVAMRKKHRAEGCKVQLRIAESTRYPGKPSIRVVGASGTRSPSHEFREALISAGFQIGDRAELRLAESAFDAAASGDAVAVMAPGRATDEASQEHSPGCISPENHDGPCPKGGFTVPCEPAQLPLRGIDSPAAGSHEPPQCTHCDKPATCIGVYEDPSGAPEPACDDCCGHGNEDGYCNPINKEEGT
jgi:hypothetical protein